MNAALVRQNVRAILEAATRRAKGRRDWQPAPGTSNAIKVWAGRDPFGGKRSGQVVLYWSVFRTTDKGPEEIRRGLWRKARATYVDNRLRMKAEARNLIYQASRDTRVRDGGQDRG